MQAHDYSAERQHLACLRTFRIIQLSCSAEVPENTPAGALAASQPCWQAHWQASFMLHRQGTHRSSGSRGSSEDDPPFVAGASDTAGIAKRQRRMAEKNRQAQILDAVPTAAVHLLL